MAAPQQDHLAAVHGLRQACLHFFDLEQSRNNEPAQPTIQAWHDLSHAALLVGAPSEIVERIAFPKMLHPVPIERMNPGGPCAHDVSGWVAAFILYGQTSARVALLAAVSDLVAWCNAEGKPAPPRTNVPTRDGSGNNKHKGKRIDENLLALIRDDPDSVSWSASKLALELHCSDSTIKECDTWQLILTTRALRAAEQKDKPDRRRHRKKKYRSDT